MRGEIVVGILGEEFHGILELHPCLSRWSTLAELRVAEPLSDAGNLAFGVVEIKDAGSLAALQTFKVSTRMRRAHPVSLLGRISATRRACRTSSAIRASRAISLFSRGAA